jgi:uncharacterized membrane protein (GlpM family)
VDSSLLKLIVTPALIGAASLAGRRWGPAVSGWLVGLPFTSAPVAFFLAIDHGPSFAAATAQGTLAGTISQALFGVVYAWLALSVGWPGSLVAGSAVFAVSTAALDRWTPSIPLLVLATAAVLLAGIRLMPRVTPGAAGAVRRPRWDLPARMIVATAVVLLLTRAAPALGPHLTGLLSPFPVYAAILAVFAHRLEGAADAVKVLRGLLMGLWSFVGFFTVLALLLERTGLAASFTASIAASLLVQGLTLLAISRKP